MNFSLLVDLIILWLGIKFAYPWLVALDGVHFFRISYRRLFLILGVVGLFCLASYYFTYKESRERVIVATVEDLGVESALQSEEFKFNLNERLMDLRLIADSMELNNFLSSSADERADELNSESIAEWLTLLLEHEDTHIASVYDELGRLSLKVHGPGDHEYCNDLDLLTIPETLVLEGLEEINLETERDEIHFNIVVPVMSREELDKRIGYLRLDFSIHNSILRWLDYPSARGHEREAVLAKSIGEDLYVFSPFRAAGPVFVRPISEVAADPIKKAMAGQVGFSAGLDYAGTAVFAWTEYLDELGATLVIKVDQAAILKPLRKEALGRAVLIGAGCMVLVLFYVTIGSRRERKFASKVILAEQAKAAAMERALVVEQRFVLALRESPFPVVLHDQDGKILHVSQSWIKFSGYDAEAFKTIHEWAALAHLGDDQFLKVVFSLDGSDDTNSIGRFKIRTAIGDVHIWEYTSSIIGCELDGTSLFMLMAVDVTNRVKRGSELNLLKKAMDYATNLIYITDAEGKMIYANSAVLKVSGYSEEELIGQNPSIFKSGTHPNQIYVDMWETLASGKPFFCEITNRRKDGSLWNQEGVITPILNDEGEISHFVAIHNDISERDELRDQLYEALNKAVEASKIKSEFMSRVSHELRTPMNGIMGMVQLLEMTEHTAEQKELIETASECSDAMMLVVDDLLDLTKTERSMVKKEAFELKEVLSSWQSRWMHVADEKNLKLELVFDQGVPDSISGDRECILKVMSKLVSNAIKFSEKGAIVVHVQYVTKLQNGVLRVLVEDEGRGVPEDYRDQVFEPFSQAEMVFTRTHGGMGMGLYLAKRMLDSVGGELFYKNRVSGGSTFGFELAVDFVDSSEPVQVERVDLSTCRVLVAEDDSANRFTIKKMLETLGVSFTIVANGQEVLDVLAQEAFDLLLLDCHMPVLDGFEACIAIRRGQMQLKHPTLPIIALTADADEKCYRNCMDVGMDGFIQKPLVLKQLRSVIMQHVFADEHMNNPEKSS